MIWGYLEILRNGPAVYSYVVIKAKLTLKSNFEPFALMRKINISQNAAICNNF